VHKSALINCSLFFDVYASRLAARQQGATVVEIGSQDVNGSLRSVTPANFAYTGIDFVPGKGVDLVLEDPYSFPLPDGCADIVLSSSCFEHSEMFWLVYLEVLRLLKPGGLFYLNVPSNGPFHRYPVDCWRFYPDSSRALIAWARRNGLNPAVLESYTSAQDEDYWNDFVAVFVKDESHAHWYPDRIMDRKPDAENAWSWGRTEIANQRQMPEDVRKRGG
jgi:SAM-dependent methyltransferase